MVHQKVGLGPYTLGSAVKLVLRHAPSLVEYADIIRDSLWGARRLSARERLALHLRLARLSRSPLALIAFPAAAHMAGLAAGEIDAALEGDTARLGHDVARVVAWADAVARAGGEMPLEWPEEARRMSMDDRERILLLTRLFIVMNSVAMLPVPERFLGVDPAELSSVRTA
jgi:alkylhydroperoxidase family enzyme